MIAPPVDTSRTRGGGGWGGGEEEEGGCHDGPACAQLNGRACRLHLIPAVWPGDEDKLDCCGR